MRAHRNTHRDIAQEPLCAVSYRKSAGLQFRDLRFVPACPVETRINFPQNRFCAVYYTQNAGPQFRDVCFCLTLATNKVYWCSNTRRLPTRWQQDLRITTSTAEDLSSNVARGHHQLSLQSTHLSNRSTGIFSVFFAYSAWWLDSNPRLIAFEFGKKNFHEQALRRTNGNHSPRMKAKSFSITTGNCMAYTPKKILQRNGIANLCRRCPNFFKSRRRHELSALLFHGT